MKTSQFLSLILLFSVFLGGAAVAANSPVSIGLTHENPIGRYAGYLKEPDGRLTLAQAMAAYEAGKFKPGNSQVLSFGIGSPPVWIHFSVNNASGGSVRQRLSIDNAWLDHVDVYFVAGGKAAATYRLGDRLPFKARPINSRFYDINHAFPSGVSDVYLRVQTPDPMVVPIYLTSLQQADVREMVEDYSYGFLYGFLFALLAYNAMLYAGLRHLRYILYSLYLGAFLLMNISYTGHGFRWLWPDSTVWAQWSNPVLMVLYASCGLFFALNFLDTRRYFPRVRRAVLAYIGVAVALELASVLFNAQRDALLVSFTYVFLFTFIMLAMGVMSVRAGVSAAKYFLLAAFSAMVGAALTALAVWGFIPFNIWTFRAVDIGMLLDATLLALALTYQFRRGQAEKTRAEELARLDPLTGINNRRAFYDIATPIWSLTLRHDRDLTVVLLDMDHFKRINDMYGHACGDEALTATARVLRKSVRDQDVIARWGGEEFILLLPETDLEEAAALAERLREAVADIRLHCDGNEIELTASFGVAQRSAQHLSLDTLISAADNRLYEAKETGRDRISYA